MDCDKLTKETKDLMFSLIDKTEKRKREHFVRLCEDKNGNITHSNFCVGSPTKFPEEDSENQKIISSVSLKKVATCECPTNTRIIGNFHTHPFSPHPSESDIVSAATARYSSICVGNRSHEWIEKMKEFRYIDNISCYDIIDEEILRLGNEAQDLAKSGNIKKAKSDVIPLMFDRIKKMSSNRVLDKKCKMSIIRP